MNRPMLSLPINLAAESCFGKYQAADDGGGFGAGDVGAWVECAAVVAATDDARHIKSEDSLAI